MKTEIKEYRYEYDLKRRKLQIWDGRQNKGGFSGDIAERHYRELQAMGRRVELVDLTDQIRRSKVKQLRAIWIKLGIDHLRDVILEDHGVTSTKELTEEQLDALIAKYQSPLASSRQHDYDRQRFLSNCLTALNKLGIYGSNSDWSAVNNYLHIPSIAILDEHGDPKMLYQMNNAELILMHRKLRSISSKYAKKYQTLAMMN